MIPRLRLTSAERQYAVAAVHRYLEDRSSIVKTVALQALSDLAQDDAALRPHVKQLLEEVLQSGTPAMRARARKLLKNIQSSEIFLPDSHPSDIGPASFREASSVNRFH